MLYPSRFARRDMSILANVQIHKTYIQNFPREESIIKYFNVASLVISHYDRLFPGEVVNISHVRTA